MIVIDAGHGGEDSGAVGNGIIEKDLTLKISKYMEERFKELGEEVAMTRTTDETVSPSERVQRVLSAFGRSPNAIVISNHINAGGGDGAEVIYALRNTSTLPNLILEEIAKKGQNVRRVYQRRLPSDTSKDYYFILRETSPLQSVLVEYGFLDSPKDDVFQLKNFYKDYAEAVVQAVMTYKGKPYIPPSSEKFYIVQKGDSLWSISKQFNISVEQLKEFNNLTTNLISVGQILNLPVEKVPEIEEPTPIEREEYIVMAGDSLYRIAQRFNTTVEEIMRLNNLTSSNLSIGQRLIISTKIPPIEEPTPIEREEYIVMAGDSLYRIAKRFNTTVEEIMRLNNLTTTNLSIGQRLILSSKTPPTEEPTPIEREEYIVVAGDSLYRIAKRFNTTVEEIMRLNNLTTTNLSIGQKLILSQSNNVFTYTVQRGDNLYSIARSFNTTVDSIKRKNNLKSDLLSIGQKLII